MEGHERIKEFTGMFRKEKENNKIKEWDQNKGIQCSFQDLLSCQSKIKFFPH